MKNHEYLGETVVISRSELGQIWQKGVSLKEIMEDFRSLASEKGISYNPDVGIAAWYDLVSKNLCMRNYVPEVREEEAE